MASTTAPQNPSRVTWSEKLGYSLGDFAANFVLQTQLMFLLNFYTDVYGVSASVVAVLMPLARVGDAVNDLVIGSLADRTHSRWGKYRPWMLATSVPLGISFWLAFAAPELSPGGKALWSAATFGLMIVLYGANNIPYSALGGVMSDDPVERVSIASWRFIFAMLAAFVVQAYTLHLIQYFGSGDVRRGYRTTIALWSAVTAVCGLAAFFMTRERVESAAPSRVSFKVGVGALLANRSWIALAGAALLVYVCLAIRGGAMLYYFQYVLDREELFGRFNAVGMAAAMVGIYCSKFLSRRMGKRNAFCAGLISSAGLTVGFYFLGPGDEHALFLNQIAFQIAFGATVPLLWGMIADVADLTEWQTGHKLTAFTFAATLFAFKIGLGVGSGLAAWILDLVGYVPNAVQQLPALIGIRAMISFLPALLLVAGGLLMLSYQITLQRERSLADELRMARQARDEIQ